MNIRLVKPNVEREAHGVIVYRRTPVGQFDVLARGALRVALMCIEVTFVRIHQGNSALHTSIVFQERCVNSIGDLKLNNHSWEMRNEK